VNPRIPLEVAPGLAPGGLVACLYSIDGKLIDRQVMASGDDSLEVGKLAYVELAAQHAGERIAAAYYDGDTGELMGSMIVGPM
jgi:hypothetical protein